MLLTAIRRAPEFAHPALLIAVPLSATRLQTRGFNQALEIAKPLAQALAIPLAPALLVRSRDTKMQALLHPDERHANMRRSDERRVGKACGSTFRSRWSPEHSKKKKT